MLLTDSMNHHCRRNEPAGLRDDSATQRCARYFRWKVALDFAIAALLLVPVGAMTAILVLLVRATSKGPGIYRQLRVGKDGRCFTIYKIRTMRIDAEAASGPVWTKPNDPRRTFLGRILRKLHLDEFPQIFNVLRGEMSFVGPRPERPEFVRVLSETIPRYRDRLFVRPGITGLAQINLPPDSDVMSVRRKLVLDLDYIEHGNLWLDVRLLFCTALRIVKVNESFLIAILGLQRPEPYIVVDLAAEACSGPKEVLPVTILPQSARTSSSNGKREEDSDLASAPMASQAPP